MDRPLKTIPVEDLRVLTSSLHDSVQNAKFIGLYDMAESIAVHRQRVDDEIKQRNLRKNFGG